MKKRNLLLMLVLLLSFCPTIAQKKVKNTSTFIREIKLTSRPVDSLVTQVIVDKKDKYLSEDYYLLINMIKKSDNVYILEMTFYFKEYFDVGHQFSLRSYPIHGCFEREGYMVFVICDFYMKEMKHTNVTKEWKYKFVNDKDSDYILPIYDPIHYGYLFLDKDILPLYPVKEIE